MKTALARNIVLLTELALIALFIGLAILAGLVFFDDVENEDVLALGLLSAVVTVGLVLLQAATLRDRRPDREPAGSSFLTVQVVAFVNAVNWVLYGLVTGTFWIAAPAIALLPLAVMTRIVLVRSSRAISEEAAAAVRQRAPLLVND